MTRSEPEPSATATAMPRGRSRVQIGLADLMAWVLAAGIAAAACRSVRPRGWLVTALLAVFLGFGLLRQAVVRHRRRHAGGGVGSRRAVAWRLAVVALLGAFLIAQARLLGGDPGDVRWRALTFRHHLVPLAATLAMVGLLTGLVPGRDRARRRIWSSVVLAGVAGVVIAATQVFLPYLILLAMDRDRDAMTGLGAPRVGRPGFHGRVLRAGIEAVPVLACCLLLGLLIARALRRPASDPGGDVASWRGPLALGGTAAASVTGAAWLVAVTIPRLDASLAEGLRVAVDPLDAVLIVLGFAGLALGPSARATGPTGPPEPIRTGSWRRAMPLRVARDLAVALVLLDFIAERLFDCWTNGVIDWLRSVATPLGIRPRDLLGIRLGDISETPEWLVLPLIQAWVAWRVAALLVLPIGDAPTPIDLSLGGVRAFGRFAIRWAALTTLMVAALPALFVAGLVVLHGLFRALG